MYHLLIDGTQMGPYTEAEVRVLAAQGQLGVDAMYWTEGMADWQQVTEWISVAPPELEYQGAPAQPAPLAPPPGATAPNRTMISAATVPRFLAYMVDYGLLLAVATKAPEMLGITKDPGATAAAVAILVAGAVFRDAIWGGRSLGRLLTNLHLMDLTRQQPATVSQGIQRNARQIGLMMAPVVPIWLLSAVVTVSIPILEFAAAIGVLTYFFTVVGSASNELGQGRWDRATNTSVMKWK